MHQWQLYGDVCVACTWSYSSVVTPGKSSCPQASHRVSSCWGWLPVLGWKNWKKTFWGSNPVSIVLCNEAEDIKRAQGLVCLLPAAMFMVGPLKQRCEGGVPKEDPCWFFCSSAAEMLGTWCMKEALVALWKWWGKLMVLLDPEFSIVAVMWKVWLPKPREDLGQINHFLGEFIAYWLPRLTHSDV